MFSKDDASAANVALCAEHVSRRNLKTAYLKHEQLDPVFVVLTTGHSDYEQPDRMFDGHTDKQIQSDRRLCDVNQAAVVSNALDRIKKHLREVTQSAIVFTVKDQQTALHLHAGAKELVA